MNELIGRTRECAELAQCVASDRSELVIVYGRRRVGKTFLIEEFFNRQFDFRYVGAHAVSFATSLTFLVHIPSRNTISRTGTRRSMLLKIILRGCRQTER